MTTCENLVIFPSHDLLHASKQGTHLLSLGTTLVLLALSVTLMPACSCLKCSTKPLLFHQISPDLARKHLKKYGPAPLAPLPARGASVRPRIPSGLETLQRGDLSEAAAVPGPSRDTASLENQQIDDFLDPGDNFGNVNQDYENNNPQICPGAFGCEPVLPSDTVYTRVELLAGPDLSEDDEDEIETILLPCFCDKEPPMFALPTFKL